MLQWIPCKSEVCEKKNNCYTYLIRDEDIDREYKERVNLIYACRAVGFTLFREIEGRPIREVIEKLPEVVEKEGEGENV